MVKPPKSRPRKSASLPSKADILKFIEDSPARVGKREIARAFGIRGAARIELKRLLRELAADGALAGPRRRLRKSGTLPKVTVVEICDIDVDGELRARPIAWDDKAPPPPIVMAPTAKGRNARPAPGLGDRFLARLTAQADGSYEAHIMRRLDAAPSRVLGVVAEVAGGLRLIPTEKRARDEFPIPADATLGARPGELVVAELRSGRQRRAGPRQATVRERLGSLNAPRSISMIAIHSHAIPTDFPPPALAQARDARPPGLTGRTDLRDLALVTIDPSDARDRDDAVWAAPDDDPKNPGGWQVIVAIADVAASVPVGSALDKAAFERGNSVYFPDRVVPMLPPELSNDLCSLAPGEDRPCIAVRMIFDAQGRHRQHRFMRAVMRSVAALSYAQVQAAADGQPDEATESLARPVIRPLYDAHAALELERSKRAPLDLDLPDWRIELSADGNVANVFHQARFTAHRLIEDFMVQANVCAAASLIDRKVACIFRVHEPPDLEKLEALRDFLATFGYRLARGQTLRPAAFNAILARAADTPNAHVINQVVLRAQSQALYSPHNLGHFGLALHHYAHFTSPIRRYADITVHRALITALGLGGDGGTLDDEARLEGIAEHISMTERRAMAAERDSNDRYLAAFMADRVGATFTARISGVTRFGLFVTLDETGADGLIPISKLTDDYYRHDAARHALIGERGRRQYRLGDAVHVRLAESAPLTGGMRFDILDSQATAPASRRGPPPRPKRRS